MVLIDYAKNVFMRSENVKSDLVFLFSYFVNNSAKAAKPLFVTKINKAMIIVRI